MSVKNVDIWEMPSEELDRLAEDIARNLGKPKSCCPHHPVRVDGCVFCVPKEEFRLFGGDFSGEGE